MPIGRTCSIPVDKGPLNMFAEAIKGATLFRPPSSAIFQERLSYCLHAADQETGPLPAVGPQQSMRAAALGPGAVNRWPRPRVGRTHGARTALVTCGHGRSVHIFLKFNLEVLTENVGESDKRQTSRGCGERGC